MAKAFEKDIDDCGLFPHPNGFTTPSHFYKGVEKETESARNRFTYPGAHLENDVHNKSYWMSVITEEIGKLCQCVNKLQIVIDPNVKKQWEREGYHRINTASSLLRRFAENWPIIPNE